MPNHITNIIKASPAVLAALKGPESLVDFNSIIPMPEGLQSSNTEVSNNRVAQILAQRSTWPDLAAFQTWPEFLAALKPDQLAMIKRETFRYFTPEDMAEICQTVKTIHTTGFSSWYDWSCANWGTKWNAYSVQEIPGGVQFDTAWSMPEPVISALAARFPDERIEIKYADEDIGSNYGWVIYDGQNGPEEMEIPDGYDFALTVKGSSREYYRANPDTGKWEYYDADEADENQEGLVA